MASVNDSSSKAAIYLNYLANCDFNTHMNPHSTIKFEGEDIQPLVSIEDDPEGALQVKQNF